VTQAHLIPHPQSKLLLLQVTFVLIIAGFVLGNLAVLITGQRVAAVNRDLAKNAILSIDNLNGVTRNIDQKRLLVDAHIFESKPEEMEALEIRIAQTDADQDKFARAFEPLSKSRGEHALWEKVWDEIVALRQPVQKALDLSRSNRDTEARARMLMIEKRFDVVNQEVSELIGINRKASHQSVDQIHDIQRRILSFIGAMTLIGGLFAVFAAVRATQIIRRRDEEIARGALLLEAHNRELDAFAGRVAHDLRGPLTTVSLSATRLTHQLSHDEQETTHQTLRRGVARMEAIIRDLLVLSRAEAMIHEAIAQTSTIAQSLEEELEPQVKGVNGVLRIQMEPASVQCSEGLLHQALWNIGENAIKYRRHEVPIHIDINGRVVRNLYEFRISDNGRGMSPEVVRRAFEPFFRGEKVQSTAGTGLGLSIVKRVVDAIGGTISVESEVGHGTTFLINIPLAMPGNDKVDVDDDSPTKGFKRRAS
jgi:signal transduction histidine kinase